MASLVAALSVLGRKSSRCRPALVQSLPYFFAACLGGGERMVWHVQSPVKVFANAHILQ